jgi:heme-degrading monooxygenase HmoA
MTGAAGEGGGAPVGSPELAEGQVVTVFRSRRRPGAGAAYAESAQAMLDAARLVPGFVDFKSFTAEDGEQVSIITFDSLDSHEAWRQDPRHREVQSRGRSEWYAQYSIQVGRCVRAHQWFADPV